MEQNSHPGTESGTLLTILMFITGLSLEDVNEVLQPISFAISIIIGLTVLYKFFKKKKH